MYNKKESIIGLFLLFNVDPHSIDAFVGFFFEVFHNDKSVGYIGTGILSKELSSRLFFGYVKYMVISKEIGKVIGNSNVYA